MEARHFLSGNYPCADPYQGLRSVEEAFQENGYVVVMESNRFLGVLTPADVIKHPHRLVIDCITEKEWVRDDDALSVVFEKLGRSHSPALPVCKEGQFVGIIEQGELIGKLKEELDRLYKALNRSQNLRTSFLNNLSHEIRTPLNTFLGFLELVSRVSESKGSHPKDSKEAIIRKSADRFLFLMNDLIDLSLICSGENVKVENRILPVEPLFVKLLASFEPSLSKPASGKRVNYQIPDNTLTLETDSEKLERILYHLIDNAVKFSEEGEVLFGCVPEEDSVTFFVTNQGSLPADCQALFEAFYRENSLPETGGLGIGLTLVKAFTELLRGKVAVSCKDNQTTLSITLPKTPSPIA